MSVTSVSNARANVAVNATSGYVKQVTGSSASAASSPLEESSETASATAQEAAKGDPVAKRLIAKQQQEKQLENPAPAQDPSKGRVVDQKA